MASLWGAVIWNHQRVEDIEIADARRDTAFLARLFAKHAAAKFSEIDNALLVLRKTWTNRPLELQDDMKQFGDSMGNAVIQTSIVNAEGYVAFTTLGLPEEPVYVGDREYFKNHQASGEDKLFISRPVKGRLSKKWSIPLTRPIFNKGKFAGLIVMSVDPQYFANFYDEGNLREGSRAVIVRDTGELMASSTELEKYIGTVVKPSPYADPGAPLRGSFRRASQVNGVESIYSYARLPAYGLSVIIGYSVEETLAPAYQLQRERLTRAIIVTLVTLFLSGLLFRALTRQETVNEALLASQLSLQASHALLEDLSKNVPGMIYRYQLFPDGRVSCPYVSKGIQTLYDLTPAQVYAEPELFLSLMHPDDRDAMQASIAESARTLQPWMLDFRITRRKEVRWVAGSAQPRKLDDGSILWHGFVSDVTDSKKTEAALKVANEELETFSYSVSHDLRSPLYTIAGFSELLGKRLNGNDDEKVHDYLSRIRLGVTKMSDLIADLLSLAQVARTNLRHEPVDLSALAGHIAKGLQARQPERQVALHIEMGLQAQGDSGLLRVALENLLSNAWKYSAKQAAAEIRFGQQTDAAGNQVFFVQDNGAGFDMAYAGKLFQPFERLHTPTEFAGTGVGLATVSRIIERHSGRIWAESTPALGATFFFTLG